ncbi:MAG: hypothetical protein WCB75_09050, partial [Pseudolabrys sp.]
QTREREIIARRICCQSKMATAIKASTRSAARSLRISVVIYPARPDLDRHGAKLSRVAFVGCRLEADTVAMFDALTRRTGA